MPRPPPSTPPDLQALRAWGGPARMNAFDAIMWTAEADPRLRSTVTAVMVLDRSPEWARLHRGHRWLVRAVPRFRQRVVVPALGLGEPTWVDDPHFDLDYHLRRVRLPAPGTRRQLFDLSQTLAMTPFDRARAPWEATFVEGLEDGQSAYILKLHHAASDGLGIIQLLERVLGQAADEADREIPPAPPRAPLRLPSPLALGLRQLGQRVRQAPDQARQQFSTASRVLRQWRQQPQDGIAYLDSARRMLANGAAPGSPLFRHRSLSWRFDGLEVPLPAFKAAAKAAGASLNDALLAALIGGYRAYHDEMGVEIGHLPISFPISLRQAHDAPGGNRFAGAQYAAPLGERDPLARIHAIQQFVRRTRQEPALDILVRLMPVVTRLPLGVTTAMTAQFTRAQDAQISNVPGIARPVYLAGARVTEFWPFPPAPGCAMMIALVSHGDRCFLGVNSDRAAVTEPELLMTCFQQGFDEVLSLAPASTTPDEGT